MTPPLGKLEHLYIGTADFDRDSAYYANVLGAERVWAFNAFGAKVAAFRLCDGPLVLLADHRPALSCMPVIAVADLDAAVAALKARGWQSEGEAFEIPNGTCYRFADPSGNAYALFQNDRPDAMERAYADQTNPNAPTRECPARPGESQGPCRACSTSCLGPCRCCWSHSFAFAPGQYSSGVKMQVEARLPRSSAASVMTHSRTPLAVWYADSSRLPFSRASSLSRLSSASRSPQSQARCRARKVQMLSPLSRIASRAAGVPTTRPNLNFACGMSTISVVLTAEPLAADAADVVVLFIRLVEMSLEVRGSEGHVWEPCWG